MKPKKVNMFGTGSNNNSIDTKRLKNVFKIDDLTNKYKEYIPLRDTQAGFGVKREYPSNIRYKPPLKRDDTPDRVALIQVVLGFPKNEEKRKRDKRIPVFVSIHLFSKYLSKHFDYDFDNTDCQNCPTKESIEKSKSTPKPINLESFDDYLYDYENDILVTTTGKVVLGEQILETLFQKHINTVHLLKGLKIRWQVRSKDLSIRILSSSIMFCKWLLKICFGRILEPGSGTARVLESYKKEDMKSVRTRSVSMFGYKVSVNVFVTFIIFMIIGLVIIHAFGIRIIATSLLNDVVMILLLLFTLILFDHLFPHIILWFINALVRYRLKQIFIEFKM